MTHRFEHRHQLGQQSQDNNHGAMQRHHQAPLATFKDVIFGDDGAMTSG